MKLKTSKLHIAATTCSAIVMLSGCAVTEDSIKASSETLHNTSEASSDFTSSTSHKDREEKKARDVHEFSESNFEQLREDMAAGSGPHLASLAALLAIPDTQRDMFYRLTKVRFSYLFSSDKTTARELLAHLASTMRNEPNLTDYTTRLAIR